MKVYTYTQARQNLSRILKECKSQDVLIRRRNGDVFRLSAARDPRSPFDVAGVTTEATTGDILEAIREVRGR